MYCIKCGKQNPDKFNYCRHCGAPLHNAKPPGAVSEQQKDADALYEMGECYWDGRNGVETDYAKAVEYYVQAADLGHVDAIYSLGFCYAKGIGIGKDILKAKKLLAYAADHGNVMAAAKMGDFYYWGVDFPEDKATGYRYLKYAADHGNAHSMAIVGKDYLSGFGAYDGWGPVKNYELGRRYLEQAAEMEEAYALYLLGHNYCGGYEGFPEDLEQGTRYLKKSAEAGHHYAQLEYAIRCWNGDGVPQSPEEYARWMKASAENGNEEAIVRWAWTRYMGMVKSAQCRNEQEFQECRNILEQALASEEYFMMENKDIMDDLHAEEARLGRRMRMTDFYGNNSGSGGASSGGGCYVATSVYGSYDCPQVWTLRRYRDYTLAKTIYGRLFIKAYYKISPILVDWFGENSLFKTFFEKKLDRMVARLNKKGYENTPYYDH